MRFSEQDRLSEEQQVKPKIDAPGLLPRAGKSPAGFALHARNMYVCKSNRSKEINRLKLTAYDICLSMCFATRAGVTGFLIRQ
jgi:hypothetical protein